MVKRLGNHQAQLVERHVDWLALHDAAAWPIQGLIAHFRHEIEARIDQYSHKADIDDIGVRDPVNMVAAE